MFAVVVTLHVDPDHWDTFGPLMQANATGSRGEAGCRQFDICTDDAHPHSVFLYELYDDRAAFDLHLTMPHFLAFDRATADMYTAKEIRTYARVTQL